MQLRGPIAPEVIGSSSDASSSASSAAWRRFRPLAGFSVGDPCTLQHTGAPSAGFAHLAEGQDASRRKIQVSREVATVVVGATAPQQLTPLPCRLGCGNYANPRSQNLCSRCFYFHMLPAVIQARELVGEQCAGRPLQSNQPWLPHGPETTGERAEQRSGRQFSIVPSASQWSVSTQRVHSSRSLAAGHSSGSDDQEPPTCTACLIVLQIGVFLYTVVLNEGVESMAVNHMIGPSAQTLYDSGGLYLFQAQYWRLLSCTFLHAGFLHLLSNILVQWWIGVAVEGSWGLRGTLMLHVLSALSGSLLSATLSTPGNISVGASGAVHGLLAVGVAGEAKALGWPSFFKSIAERMGSFGDWFGWRAIVMVLLLSLIGGLVSPSVDSWAHLGGAIGGFALAAVRRRGRGVWRLLARLFAAAVGLFHVTACIYLLFFCSHCLAPPGQVAQVMM